MGNMKCILDVANMIEKELHNISMTEIGVMGSTDFIKMLYENYTKRFLNDNSVIWKTASIFIPLSFGPLVFLAQIEHPKVFHGAILFMSSIMIYSAWLIIAEIYRSFQNKSLAWIIAIEIFLDLRNTGGNKIKDHFISRSITVQSMRSILLFGLIFSWIIAFVCWPQ